MFHTTNKVNHYCLQGKFEPIYSIHFDKLNSSNASHTSILLTFIVVVTKQRSSHFSSYKVDTERNMDSLHDQAYSIWLTTFTTLQ